jgi:hypothetical protein
MKERLLIGVLLAAAGAAAHAQEPARGALTLTVDGQSMMPARASTVVESRITTGRPYSAEATTEFVQVLGDGNKIVRKASVRVYRDGEGRTRREEIASDGTVKSISIYDPVSHVTFVLDPATRIARKSAVRVVYPSPLTDDQKREMETKLKTELVARERVAGKVALVAPADVPAEAASLEIRKRQVETMAAAGGVGAGVLQPALRSESRAVQEESLGQKAFDGVLADGKRVTTVLPAGAIGNQQPITVQSEQWFAPDLEILVMTRHSDPRTGETAYALSNIVRAEPAAGLFDVPADYTIQESSYLRTPAFDNPR